MLTACSAAPRQALPVAPPRYTTAAPKVVVDLPERAASYAVPQSGNVADAPPRAIGDSSARPLVGRISGSLPVISTPQADDDLQANAGTAVAPFGDTRPVTRVLWEQRYQPGPVVDCGPAPVALGIGIAVGYGLLHHAGRFLVRGPLRSMGRAVRSLR